jgi:isopenicillin-N N-acyltransferase like protein
MVLSTFFGEKPILFKLLHQPGSMRFLKVSGTAIEIGKALGREFRTGIIERAARLKKRCWKPEYAAILRIIQETCSAQYPAYMDELRGMAEGSGAAFDDILFLNVLELHGHGCSSLAQCDAEACMIAHNEDGDSDEFPKDFAIVTSTSQGKTITYFYYPGELAGSAFGWNKAGLFLTVNNLRPIADASAIRVPKTFTSRSILDAYSIQEALARISRSGCIGGLHYFIGDRDMICSVEKLMNQAVVSEVKGVRVHTNHYLYPPFVGKDKPEEDSYSRLLRLEGLKGKSSFIDILQDREGKHPILCAGEGHSRTIATVVADLKSGAVEVLSDGITARYEMQQQQPQIQGSLQESRN